MTHDKRSLLLDASIDLFASQGFWNTSTAAIAKHAKVATGTLFNYFPSKQALIDAVYLELKQRLLAQLPKSMEGDCQFIMQSTWQAFVHWALTEPEQYDLTMQLKMSQLVSNQAMESSFSQFQGFVQLIELQVAKGGLFKPLDANYVMEIINKQLEANIGFAKQHQLSGRLLENHVDLGFKVLWQGLIHNK